VHERTAPLAKCDDQRRMIYDSLSDAALRCVDAISKLPPSLLNGAAPHNIMHDDELILPGMTEREIAIRRRVHRLADFYRHLFVYVLVNAGLWVFNAWTISQMSGKANAWMWWAVWPTLWWGVGILIHGLSVLQWLSFFSQDWEDKKVKELMERDRS
jgi:2TM domain